MFVFIGFWDRVIKPWRNRALQPRWMVMGTLLISVWIFHCLVPSSLEERNLMGGIPALALFFVAGCTWVVDRNFVGHIKWDQQVTILTLVIAAIFVGMAFATPNPVFTGFGEVAQRLLASSTFDDSVML